MIYVSGYRLYSYYESGSLDLKKHASIGVVCSPANLWMVTKNGYVDEKICRLIADHRTGSDLQRGLLLETEGGPMAVGCLKRINCS